MDTQRKVKMGKIEKQSVVVAIKFIISFRIFLRLTENRWFRFASPKLAYSRNVIVNSQITLRKLKANKSQPTLDQKIYAIGNK